uniref:Actin-related protein 10 n=1 Tax=Timema shepardi TaxID=629360 RepID=A0A7R9AWN8_TIMSH|nr:unnamed protein product [Timema shepardi]
MISDVDPTPTAPCYTTACLRFFSLPPPFPPLINSKPSNLICTKLHVGSPEAGLAETIEFVLKGYSVDVQALLVSNIFLTGGCASIPGLVPRLDKELREMRPFESQFHLTLAADPVTRCLAWCPRVNCKLLSLSLLCHKSRCSGRVNSSDESKEQRLSPSFSKALAIGTPSVG